MMNAVIMITGQVNLWKRCLETTILKIENIYWCEWISLDLQQKGIMEKEADDFEKLMKRNGLSLSEKFFNPTHVWFEYIWSLQQIFGFFITFQCHYVYECIWNY